MQLFVLALLGILLGGVVNVLTDDLPQRRRPRLPHYPDDTPRPVIAWLGITAFAFGKRAAPTGSILPWRHPITEAATALALVIGLLQIRTFEDPTHPVQLIFWLAYLVILVLVTVIDLEHRLILEVVIFPSCVLALADALLFPVIGGAPALITALGGAALGFGVFFGFYMGGFLYSYISATLRGFDNEEVAFGYGDVMLATLCGLILGWRSMIFAIFLTVFLGAFGAMFWIIGRKLARKNTSLFTPLPYGPYIVAGTVAMLLFNDFIREWVIGAVY